MTHPTAASDEPLLTQGEFVAAPLTSNAELAEAGALYRRVFGYGGSQFTLNPLLLQGMLHNGGSAVGVRDRQGDLVGFAYGFAGSDGHVMYHYSQAAVIDQAVQGKGVGRMLKLAQREVARGWGAHTMRWAFDPAYSRNAHFNLDSLGGRGILFYPDFYHNGMSDRMIIEWDLDAPGKPRVPAIEPEARDELLGRELGDPLADGDAYWVALPSHLVAGGPVTEPATVAARERLSAALLDLIGDRRDYQAVSCQRLGEHASAYRLEPVAQDGAAAQEGPAAR